jgi:hypothetical protein
MIIFYFCFSEKVHKKFKSSSKLVFIIYKTNSICPDGVPRRPPETHGVEPGLALNEVGRLPSPQH